MRVPFSWVKEYVAWEGAVEEMAELLTMSGTEVEGIARVGAPRDAGNLDRFVVGRVVTKEKHPNADRLNLCTVEVGEKNGGMRQIVCGAHNFAAGDIVPVSLSGAVLESGLKLKKANLRGVESDGMIMSEQELGYEDESPGIAVLPRDWVVGEPLQRYLPVSEEVLELEITSNRPDCFSIYGIAREIAAAAGLDLAPPPIAPAAVFGGAPAADDIQVEIADPELCGRYGATVIRGVRITDSPAWLKARLTHAGMRPIDNVVDVTNYVMLAYGQPLHAFDAGKIRGGRLIVRRATAGERIVTLDGVERTLDAQMLVIADVERALVIAGVFGSQDAEIDERTTDIVLEAANFSGPSILRTEHHTGLRSEASNRFEKGIDPHLVPGALDFAGRLLAGLCGGTVAPGMVDAGGVPPAPGAIGYRPARTGALLGYPVPEPEQAAILRRLECEVVPDGEPEAAVGSGDAGSTQPSGDAAGWSVIPPTFRPDLTREVDLIEEVGRIAGYGLAPETLPRHATVGGLTKEQRVRRAVHRALAGCGLDEVITYSFIAPEALAPLGLPQDDPRLDPVRLANPMSGDQSVLRTTLLPGLLKTVADNVDRLNDPPNLFEVGRVYLWDEPEPVPPHAAEPGTVLPHEPEVIGIVLSGPLEPENWTGAARPADFYTLKGCVDALLGSLGLTGEYAPLGDAVERSPYLHPGKSAVVGIEGVGHIGVLGQLRPDVAAVYGIDDLTLYVGSLDATFVRTASRVRGFQDIGAYPPAAQDLAVVVGREVPAAMVVDQARRAGGKLVRSVRVFDMYEGDQVPADKRSLALRVVMRSPERTLKDKDIAGVRARILKALEREFQATLR